MFTAVRSRLELVAEMSLSVGNNVACFSSTYLGTHDMTWEFNGRPLRGTTRR